MAIWHVHYELTTRGVAEVEADTADEAVAMVDGGEFDANTGEERVDWGATSGAKLIDP